MAEWQDIYWTGADGLRLHCRDYAGSADRLPLLCLHGLTRNARDFEEVAARHAGERRVIAPDFRGRGQSDRDPVPERYSPPVYAADVQRLLSRLGVERAVFLGTSLGGIVTMIVAATDRRLVAGAILNDVGPVLETAGLERIGGYVGQAPVFASWDEAASAVAATNARVYPDYTDADWREMARRLCREHADGIRFDYDPAIAVNFHAARNAPAVDAWPLFDALDGSPLLIVRGETSDLFSRDVAEAMAARHSDAELVTVPDVGHAPTLSEPEAVAAIDRLLARVG